MAGGNSIEGYGVIQKQGYTCIYSETNDKNHHGTGRLPETNKRIKGGKAPRVQLTSCATSLIRKTHAPLLRGSVHFQTLEKPLI